MEENKNKPSIECNNNGDLGETLYTVDEVLNEIGLGKAQYVVFVSMGFCIMASIMDIMGMGFIVPYAKCDLELDTFKIGILTGIVFLGIMCSQHLWGFIADVVGRRHVILVSLLLSLAFSLPIAFTQNFWIIVALQFFKGVSLAGFSTILYPYCGEFFPEKFRGSAIIFVTTFAGMTMVIVPGIGWILAQYPFTVKISDSFVMLPWRFQIMIQLIPGVLCILILVFLPESPKFLASVNKEKETLIVLQWVFCTNTGKPVSEFLIQKLEFPKIEDSEKQYNKKTLKGLCRSIVHETVIIFKPPHLGRFLKCCYIQAAIFVVGSGLVLWYPQLTSILSESDKSGSSVCEIINQSNLEKANASLFEGTDTCKVIQNDQMIYSNITFGLCLSLSFVVLGFIAQKVNKNILMSICLLISGFCGIILYWIKDEILMIGLFLGLLMFSGISICLVAASVVDLFPTNIRGMAISLTILVGRTATFVSAATMGLLLNLNCDATFFVVSIMVLVAGVMSWCLPRK